jgi:hypothetical protein
MREREEKREVKIKVCVYTNDCRKMQVSCIGYKATIGIYDLHISLIISPDHSLFLQPTPNLA